MTPLSQMLHHNNNVIKLIYILQKKGKLTEDIINNIISMLLEESGNLLERNNENEYLKVKDTLRLIELIEI